MIFPKKLNVLYIVCYTILAHVFSTILKTHWLNTFNTLILVAILYHILEWKYEWVDREGDNNE